MLIAASDTIRSRRFTEMQEAKACILLYVRSVCQITKTRHTHIQHIQIDEKRTTILAEGFDPV